MAANEKRQLFEHYRKSLDATELETSSKEALICPLCWEEAGFESLSIDHALASALGGTCTILTCRRCNNEHGSTLESRLASFQTIVDAFQGHGSLPVKLEANGNKVAANLEWGADSKNFKIVGKASDPTASAAIEADLKAGRVPKFAFTVPVPMVTNAIRTAVLRAAYLLAFKCFGYEYARNDVIQVVRRRIMDRSLPFPQLETLVLQFQNCNIPYDEPHLLARVVVHDLEALLVVLRVRRATTSYLGAFLPSPVEVCNEFFEIMHKASIELDGQTLTIARESLFI